MSRDEWLEARKMGIGGSDAGAILGLNPYSSPTRVFLDKTGQAEPQADNYAMKIGRDLEDYVARLFTEETGKKVRRRNAMLINDSYPFAVANVDREVVGEKSLLECKTTSKLDPQDLRDGIAPDSYYCQCMHYLAVTGMERIYLAIQNLSDPKTFEILEITRNDETIESLMETEETFWNDYVKQNILPPPDGSDATEKAYKSFFKHSRPELPTVDLNGLEADFERRAILIQQKKEIEREINMIDERAKMMMDEAEKAETDSWNISWKTQKRRTLDTNRIKTEDPELYDLYGKESESRVFRVTRKKNTRRKRING